MPDKTYDLIVIGSGPAGEKAAVKAAYFGHSVALVEKMPDLGGAGVNTGTLPSKTLKESALYYSGKRDKGLYGADRLLERETSIEDFMFRKELICKAMRDDVRQNLQAHKVELIQGEARFGDQHRILVKTGSQDRELRGRFILIATGSYPYQPKEIPFDGRRILDSDSILTITRIPKSLCIVGAGVIGCEYATIFAAMGTKVHLVNNRDEILGFIDDEITSALVKEMRTDGVEIHFNTDLGLVKAPAGRDDPVRVGLSSGDELEVEMFLFAAGRSGATRALDCAVAGFKVGKREAIEVDANYRTSVPHIYAVGDCIGFPALASTSMDQGRVAVSHMFGINDLDSLSKWIPYGIYTIPEVSMVGMTQEDAVAQGLPFEVGRAHHSNMARGKIMGTRDGLLKLVFERETQVIKGVHIIGPQASELIHYGLTLVEGQKTLSQVTASVFNYPTLHDLYKYAAYDGLGNLKGQKIRDL